MISCNPTVLATEGPVRRARRWDPLRGTEVHDIPCHWDKAGAAVAPARHLAARWYGAAMRGSGAVPIVLRPMTVATAAAILAGRRPDDVVVALDYPTEFSA